MTQKLKNYAFVDGQNVNLSIQKLGWNMNWAALREYLRNSYDVDVAYLFIGFMPENQELYASLQKAGFVLVFKPVHVSRDGVKGNVDAEMVLQAMVDLNNYDQAVIVSGDSDFYCLVRHLNDHDKLASLMVPDKRHFNAILADAAKERIVFLNNRRRQLEYKRGGSNRGHKPAHDKAPAPAGDAAKPRPADNQ